MPVNYVYLKKNGNIVYPKTKLSAIDMILDNGLQISGETLSLSVATALQVKQGSTSRIVTADGLKSAITTYEDAIYIPGDSILISAGTLSLASVDVKEAVAGTTKLAYAINNKTLNGAINMGRAVDVSSEVGQNSFTATTADGVTTLVKTSATGTYLYYGWTTKYPKFANGFKYLIMADVKNTGDAVTIAARLHSGATAIGDIPYSHNGVQNEEAFTRIASLFTTEGAVGLIVTRGSATSIDIKLKNYKVFEVTALNDDAIYALAKSENPDEVYEKFLIKQDAVCPWIDIIPMFNSPAVTIGAGLAYSLIANDGSAHELMVDTFPVGAYGRDAYITIFVGEASYVQVKPPLVLMDPLTPNAVNHCVVKFRNGYARMYVSDTDYGYTVTIDSGADYGSLKYGILSSSEDYIVVAGTLDGVPINFEGVVAPNNRGVTIVGRGTDTTILTGDVSPTSNVKFTKLSLADVNVSGGVMVIPAGVEIMSGSTVSTVGGSVVFNGGHIASDAEVFTSSGALTLNSATIDGTLHCSGASVTQACSINGNGSGVIDFGGGDMVATVPVEMQNVSVINGSAVVGVVYKVSSGLATLTNCTFSNNQNAAVYVGSSGGSAVISSCTFIDNNLGAYVNSPATADFIDCTFSNQTNRAIQNNGDIKLGGTIVLGQEDCISGTAKVTISSGAIVNLYGNSNATPINPGGGVTFAQGGATVVTSDGESYMLGGVTVPKVGNGRVIDLSSSPSIYVTGSAVKVNGATIANCPFTSVSLGAFYCSKGGVLELTSCTLTNNCKNAYGGAIAVLNSGTAILSSCYVSGNQGASLSYQNGIYVHMAAIEFTDCEIQDVVQLRGSCNATITGSNTFDQIKAFSNDTTAKIITISSGAIINLSSSITTSNTSNITVLAGGCTVNGVAVAAGTYTSIVNSGGTIVVN